MPLEPTEGFLAAVKSLAASISCECRNPKWTSYGALEVDFFGQSKADFDLFLDAVSPLAKVEFARDLNVAPPYKPEAELFKEAIEYFNHERYWESHEVLEGIWRTKNGAEKSLLQGLILVCAAFVHHQKGEDEVGKGILVRALPQLVHAERTYGGFDVDEIRRNSRMILDTGRFFDFPA